MSTERLGGVTAILTGFLSGAFVILFFVSAPASFEAGGSAWHALTADYLLALTGLTGLAAVPALTARVAPAGAAWAEWTSRVALLGFALLAVMNFWQAEYDMLPGDAGFDVPAFPYDMTSDVVEDVEGSLAASVDAFLARAPHGWIEVAGVGLWVLSVSWAGLQSGMLPSGLAGTGVAAGFLTFCAAAGANLNLPMLHLLGTLGWSVVVPVWLVWSGVHLLSAERSAQAELVLPGGLVPDARWAERAPEPPRRKRRASPLIRLWPR